MLIFRMLGSLGLLMFGMKMMSDALQKMAGPGLRHILGTMTTNRFTGMLTGVFVTAAVQSSTATTVMTVSFVNAGLLTLAQAISVIMGANIGTTMTAWIMSVAQGFNVTNFVWPTFIIAMVLIYKKKNADLGDFLFGLAFMLLGLGTLRQTGTDMELGSNPVLLEFFAGFDPNSFSTTIIFLLLGGVLTMCVQSSAAVMAITMVLCSSGALPIYQGIALVMGENIGTTVTSNIAALSASTQARRAAFAHLFFNLFGVCWMLLVFHPFVDAVCGMVGYDTEMTREVAGEAAFLANAAKLTVVLAAFHTCFNLANTAILIGFISQIERIVRWVIREKPQTDGEPATNLGLKYIEAGIIKTPEIAVLQAQKEVALFGKRMERMVVMVQEMLDEKDPEAFAKLLQRVRKYEGISDNMELEIAHYLEQVGDAHLSDDTKAKIRMMMREVGELESIGDACFKMGRTLNRSREVESSFTDSQKANMKQMIQLTQRAMAQMNVVLSGRLEELSTEPSLQLEDEINSLRATLKERNIADIGEHLYDYGVGTAYMDIINTCEKVGDYIINVVEARFGKKL